MIISNLNSEFVPLLKHAEEFWLAVALVKDKTFEHIQNTLNRDCIQHHLVGIDLPTPPSVLRTMQSKVKKGLFECAIYKSDFNFHPKVYLIKSNDEYLAFVGSANLTDGGFVNNVELTYKISNQADCLEILNWFNSLFEDGYPLTDENIDEYESQLESIKETEKELKRKRK